MLPLSQRVAFALFALVTITLGARGMYRVYLRIARGRKDSEPRTDGVAERMWYAVRTALTQARVFRKRPILGIFHAFIFYAFLLYMLLNLVDAVEGFVVLPLFPSTQVRTLYGSLADWFSLLAVIGVLAFVFRRFFSKSRRDFSFNQSTLLHDKVRQGYIERDSLIVSAFIIFHIVSRVIANAAKLAIHGPSRAQPLSSLIAPFLTTHDPAAWRIFGYWGALGSVLLFLVYFPYTKHMHLLMAPLNYFLRRKANSGELPPLEIDLDATDPQLGAQMLSDLAWPRLLDAYACIQCNRCQDVCPASQTGKALSPAALEINKRMALNTVAGEVSAFSLSAKAGFAIDASPDKKLLQIIISPASVWACTTCGACMEACPTLNEPMLDIVDIRRRQVMLESDFPAHLQTAFRGMERTGNPWSISREKRMDWTASLHVPSIEEIPDPDVLYWVGCAASYDSSAQKTARAVVQLLAEGHVRFAVLGKRESCTGDSARRAGNEMLYQQLATEAVRTLNAVRPRLIIASCPHCVNTIDVEYPQFGGHYTVMHHTEYFASMLHNGLFHPSPSDAAITFHDPCYLGRHRRTYDQPRSILNVLTNDYVELERMKSNSFCCGAGGGQFWKEEEQGAERISENRFHEAQRVLAPATNQKVLAVGCPFCKSMLQSTPAAADDPSIVVKDVAELLLDGVNRSKRKGVPQKDTPLASSFLQPSPLADVISSQDKSPQASVVSGMATATSEVRTDHSEPEPAARLDSSAEPPRERKTWTPKLSSHAPDTPDAITPPTISAEQATSTDLLDKSLPPARKKWQPKEGP